MAKRKTMNKKMKGTIGTKKKKEMKNKIQSKKNMKSRKYK